MTKAYRWRVAAVVAIGPFMAILDTTIVSMAILSSQKMSYTESILTPFAKSTEKRIFYRKICINTGKYLRKQAKRYRENADICTHFIVKKPQYKMGIL
jgi:hypothetical protein